MTDTDMTAEETQTPEQLLIELSELHMRTHVSPLPKHPGAMGWQATTGAMAAGFARTLYALMEVAPEKAVEVADWFQGPFGEGPDAEEHTDWTERHVAQSSYVLEQWAQEAKELAVQAQKATERMEKEHRDAETLAGATPIVAICGSARFMADMVDADREETAAGRIVVKPGCNMKTPHELWDTEEKAEPLKVRLGELHRAKIRMASEVLIVGDYIGTSTTAEIRYARSLGKPVRFTHPEVDPAVAL